jgi:hydroxyacylglutathione hydrolase
MANARALIVPVTAFQQNCTILWDDAAKVGAVVDPGGDLDDIEGAIARSGARIETILLTHGHFDHAGGAKALAARLGAPVVGPHLGDKFLLDTLDKAGMAYGLPGAEPVTPDRWLEEGDQVMVGSIALDVLHCPGHSPGSVVFVDKAQRYALVGDVIFAGSIGRTDLPGGDHATLIRSIREKVLPLGDDMRFVCGHGPQGVVGQERLTNPFLV